MHTILIRAAGTCAGLLLYCSVVTTGRAEVIALVCARYDIANPLDTYYTIDTAASTVTDRNWSGTPPVFPAKITGAAIEWLEPNTGPSGTSTTYQIDRLSGLLHRFWTADPATGFRLKCKKAQGF